MTAQCIGCPYGRACCRTRGPEDAPVVIVGEAPGAMEEASGEPFVGDSGRLLDGVIGGADLPIFYTNAMQCRPASHLEPYAEGIAACRPRLLDEIGAHPRRVVIALGNSAIRSLFPDMDTKITDVRGQYLRLPDGTPVVPALHPAAVLRAVGYYRHFARDIKRALEIGGGGEVPTPGETNHQILNWAHQVEWLGKKILSLPAGTLVAFDVETSGLNPRTDRVQYLGISVEPHFTYIIPDDLILHLAEAVQGPQAWCGHNTQFDVKFLRAMGLPIRIDHDTQLMHGCLDEVPGGHGLKTLANEYLGTNDYESELTAYKKAHGITGDYTQIPAEILIPYLAMDADYTLRLARLLLPQVEAQPDLKRLYYETLLPATRMLMEVERAGMWMDPEKVEIARAKLTIERDNWLATIKEEIEPVWDSDAYRKETGSKAGLKGRTARQAERYSYTSRMKTLWMLQALKLEVANLQQKTLRAALSIATEGEPAHGFLTVYLAQKAVAEEIKALKDDRTIAPEDADAIYAQRDLAQLAMDSWAAVYWNPAAYLAAGQRKEDIPFSPGSHKQVLWICKRFAIPVSDTQEGTLKGYAKTIPFIEALFGYRGAVKALGTYVDAISEIVSKEADGRVHATYRTTGTVTGRLSSAEPNLQNIPRDPMLRGMFGAPPGRILVEADLSQAELRTLAHFSGDEFLKGVYEAGRDLHSEMAAAIFGPGYTKEQRTGAKTTNFGIAYGLSAHGLSHQLGLSLDAAQAMIDGWYARLPRAKAYLEACRAAPLAGRILTTPFGRRRRYGLITDENRDAVQREATNYAIQSTASDIALHAGIEAQPKLPALDSFIVNIVHDSIIAECPDDGVTPQKVARLLVEIMRRIPSERIGFRVPMDADAKIGRHWGLLQDWEENE